MGADLVEEIMRIDGLDNVEIPALISIAPAVETLAHEAAYREKLANYLSGAGFNEIFTNSISNSAYYGEETLAQTVKMINSLSAELDVMRPDMLQSGLESIAYNLNRKNNDLLLYEFGKVYSTPAPGKYTENNRLAIYVTGKKSKDGWKLKGEKADFYFVKAITEKLVSLLGLNLSAWQTASEAGFTAAIAAKIKNDTIATTGILSNELLGRFDIKQPVYYASLDWDRLMELSKKQRLHFTEIPKYPAVQRDLAIVVDKALPYEAVEKATTAAKISRLKAVNLFDVFESDKLGTGKKSMAINFTFLDEEKTMTDKEIDGMMGKIISAYEKELNAEVRK